MNCLYAVFCPYLKTSDQAEPERKNDSRINSLDNSQQHLHGILKNQAADRSVISRKTEAQELASQFHNAVLDNDVDACEALVDDVDTNAVIPGTVYAPLSLAAMRGETEMVKFLIDHTNHATGSSNAVGLARQRGYGEIVRLISEKTPSGDTLSGDQAELISLL